MRNFLRTEAAAGTMLLFTLPLTLLWANSSGTYETWWRSAFGPLDARHWVNDVLMTLFFFVVAAEVRREVTDGVFRHRRTAVTPIAAALGGMLVPAFIYWAMNAGSDVEKGWGIPMATDIAVALPFFLLAGNRTPRALKAFLLTLAVVDDIGAVVVIALFYADSLNVVAVASAAMLFVGVFLSKRVVPLSFVLFAGAWLVTYHSGIHPTIAGVFFAFLLDKKALQRVAPLLLSSTSYLVLPLFVLANAGIVISSTAVREALESPLALGVIVALLVGKPLGICLSTYLATLLGGRLPHGATPSGIVALSIFGGMGFTVSLFVTDLAFADGTRTQLAKTGILVASLCAGLFGICALRLHARFRTFGTSERSADNPH